MTVQFLFNLEQFSDVNSIILGVVKFYGHSVLGFFVNKGLNYELTFNVKDKVRTVVIDDHDLSQVSRLLKSSDNSNFLGCIELDIYVESGINCEVNTKALYPNLPSKLYLATIATRGTQVSNIPGHFQFNVWDFNVSNVEIIASVDFEDHISKIQEVLFFDIKVYGAYILKILQLGVLSYLYESKGKQRFSADCEWKINAAKEEFTKYLSSVENAEINVPTIKVVEQETQKLLPASENEAREILVKTDDQEISKETVINTNINVKPMTNNFVFSYNTADINRASKQIKGKLTIPAAWVKRNASNIPACLFSVGAEQYIQFEYMNNIRLVKMNNLKDPNICIKNVCKDQTIIQIVFSLDISSRKDLRSSEEGVPLASYNAETVIGTKTSIVIREFNSSEFDSRVLQIRNVIEAYIPILETSFLTQSSSIPVVAKPKSAPSIKVDVCPKTKKRQEKYKQSVVEAMKEVRACWCPESVVVSETESLVTVSSNVENTVEVEVEVEEVKEVVVAKVINKPILLDAKAKKAAKKAAKKIQKLKQTEIETSVEIISEIEPEITVSKEIIVEVKQEIEQKVTISEVEVLINPPNLTEVKPMSGFKFNRSAEVVSSVKEEIEVPIVEAVAAPEITVEPIAKDVAPVVAPVSTPIIEAKTMQNSAINRARAAASAPVTPVVNKEEVLASPNVKDVASSDAKVLASVEIVVNITMTSRLIPDSVFGTIQDKNKGAIINTRSCGLILKNSNENSAYATFRPVPAIKQDSYGNNNMAVVIFHYEDGSKEILDVNHTVKFWDNVLDVEDISSADINFLVKTQFRMDAFALEEGIRDGSIRAYSIKFDNLNANMFANPQSSAFSNALTLPVVKDVWATPLRNTVEVAQKGQKFAMSPKFFSTETVAEESVDYKLFMHRSNSVAKSVTSTSAKTTAAVAGAAFVYGESAPIPNVSMVKDVAPVAPAVDEEKVALRKENAELKLEISGLKLSIEALTANMAALTAAVIGNNVPSIVAPIVEVVEETISVVVETVVKTQEELDADVEDAKDHLQTVNACEWGDDRDELIMEANMLIKKAVEAAKTPEQKAKEAAGRAASKAESLAAGHNPALVSLFYD